MAETLERESTARAPDLPAKADYSLTGVNYTLAVEKGLAEADWYQCHVPREAMRKLLVRRDGPAIHDTIVWIALIAACGYATYALWGSWWAVVPYLAYSVLYASTSDSRWHETGHGTAFKADWMNNALYELASFMIMRESTIWRWSHNRHHSDTIIVGRDPEIAVQRPPDVKGLVFSFFNLRIYPKYFRNLVVHSLGRMNGDEKTFVPESEYRTVYAKARIYLLIYCATAGLCTHGNTHLADGLVMGNVIECPKHNGRFNLVDGSPARAPVCRGLTTYPVKELGGRLHLNITDAGGAGARQQLSYHLKVVSNYNVATFIKELVLEPAGSPEPIAFTPGDYLQFEIPTYDEIRFRDFDIPEPYAAVWERQHVFDLVARNTGPSGRNNYSFASNSQTEALLRFNIRIATPPPGQECPPGIGSSYMFSLKAGDVVTATGPYGDFHIKPTQREIVFVGGGAGMAPLRAQLSHLFDTQRTSRMVSFWYGARSRQEMFYEDYFRSLESRFRNFSFHIALSSPLPEDNWTGHTGLIHEVLLEKFLRDHPSPQNVEYYLCGPPQMTKACTRLLSELEVRDSRIAYDEF